MSFRIFLVLAAASVLSLAQAPAKNAPAKSASSISNADHKFLEEALQGNRAEVALGRLASQKAMDPQVKAFGDTMVKDHTQGVMEIEALAKNLGVTLAPEKQDSKQAKLEKLNGAAFDKAYVSDMVSDHKKDVSEFKKASTSASNPEVKALAAKMLPTLQMHLDRINMIQAQMSGKKSADRTAPSPTTAPHESIPSTTQPNPSTTPKK
jgi:putative membrane protein